MADTKIINIQKDDAFEEVFNEFERAEASEVIFIMPKSSKFARREEHFAALEEELEVEDKDSDDDVAIPLSVQPEPWIEPTEAPAGYTTELTAIRSDKGAIYPRINTAEDRIEAIRPRRLVDAKRTEAIEDDWLQKS